MSTPVKTRKYSWMTKDLYMTYTAGALVILAAISILFWYNVTEPQGVFPWNNLGLTSGIICLLAVGVAVGLDFLLAKTTHGDSPQNTMSALVFGLIVAMSYSIGVPSMASTLGVPEALPLEAPGSFIFVIAIAAIGLVVFKKIQGKLGRKYVNPAAAAKLLVTVPFLGSILFPAEHLTSGVLQMPSLAGPIGWGFLGNNGGFGVNSFADYMIGCFANPMISPPPVTNFNNVMQVLALEKYHGWIGGASAVAVIVVGIALAILARRYYEWRIPLTYLATVTGMSLILTGIYGGDPILRIAFELFIGSSIFMAFFMATDPATTPLTHKGHIIFGAGLGVLTVLIQTYMGFFGGSILALVIMNLAVTQLDKIGLPKPRATRKEQPVPRGKEFKPEDVKTTACIRCGLCLQVCCKNLAPILIREALERNDMEALDRLHAEYCEGCGECSYVCPARIELKNSSLKAKGALIKYKKEQQQIKDAEKANPTS
jgi:electron transport complex protein RnfD